MKRKSIVLIFCLLTVLMASLTLTRCGSGVGRLVSSDANGVKF